MVGPHQQALSDYLYGNPDRVTKHFSITPGPNFEAETACEQILKSLLMSDRGELKEVNFEELKDL